MKTTLTGDIVKQYLERFPNLGARTLAGKIYAENSVVFTSQEYARTIIRHHLGQKGAINRIGLTDTRFIRDARKSNPYGIPESDAIPWAPVHIPSIYNRGLVISDIHYPYHDMQAINAMLEYTVKNKKINFIFINGDGIDCYQGSKFNRDPRNRSLSNEIWGWIEFLNMLKEVFPGVKIFWKLGNHEARMENYLRIKAPELLDFSEFKLGEIIKIRGLQDIDVIDKQI